MNHIYHSIWNEALGAWIAVSEIATGQGKRSSNRRKLLISRHTRKDAGIQSQGREAYKLLAISLLLTTTTAHALPTGNELIAGQATVNTPNTGQMQINQASQNAIINWQGFSIDQNQAVNIQQPNTNAALLNRVVGQDASQIQGQLNANGQVYLVNPNGVLFSKTAQVDVGGLIASTHNITNADFMNGNHHFTQNGATGSIENQGNIKTPEGGIVALIGKQVSNSGTIETPKGTTALAAGKTVDLDFQGNGLIEVKVTEAALNAQITNQGAIQADGGHVILTANAAGQLIDTVINSQGVIQARGLIEKNGVIKLSGGNQGTVEIGGIIDTSGNSNLGLNSKGGDITVTGAKIHLQDTANLNASGNTGGGIITIGDKQTTRQTTIQQGATVTTQTLDSGTAGTINVLANMNDGKVQVDGQLNAAAPKNGDGGFIDTSAAHVNVADTAKISTKAANGKTGKWLIDPTDYKIAASGGNLTGAALTNYLNTSNVEIQTLGTGSTGLGDIFVNDAVSWNNSNNLTLTAHRNVNVNAFIEAAGNGSVKLRADSLGTGTGTVSFTGNGHIVANNGAAVDIYYNPVSYTDAATKSDSLGNPYSSKVTLNIGSKLTAYMLVNDVNKLQAMNTNLNGNYALGKNIDASTSVSWNNGAGFVPVGTGGWQQSGSLAFRGKFSGLNHTISGLFINRPTTDNVALFGTVFNPAIISNIGLVGGSIRGQSSVGSLIGWNENGKVIDSYATTEIFGFGGANIGGLMGVNSWTGLISGSYATGNVNAGNSVSVGGLAGHNQGVINNSFATGAVSGLQSIGGLVGNNYTNSGKITNSYATGSVSGTTNVGGLVGLNTSATNVSNYWDTQTSGRATSASGTGLTTAQMKQQASFTGWDFANTWQINQGVSYPTLRASNTQPPASIITPIVVTTSSNSTPIDPSSLINVSTQSNSTSTDTSSSINVSTQSNSTSISDNSSNTDINGNADSTVKTFMGPKQNIELPNSGLFLVTDNMSGQGSLVPSCQFSGSCVDVEVLASNQSNPNYTVPQPNDATPYIVKTKKEKDPIAVFVTKLKMSYGYQLYNYTESLLSDGSVNINFSAYNNRNVFAAIEVFDASGNVVDTQYIDSKTLNDSVSGTLTDQAYSFVDGKTGFQDSLMSKQSDINLTVPKGGYVKISYNSDAAKIANLANQVVSLVLSLIEIDGKNSVASRQIKNYALDIAKGIFGDIASEATRGGVYSVADFYEKFKSTITTPENINKLSSALQSMVLAGNMNVKGKLLNKVNAWVVPAEMTVKALNVAAAVIAVKTDYSETDRRFTPSILR